MTSSESNNLHDRKVKRTEGLKTVTDSRLLGKDMKAATEQKKQDVKRLGLLAESLGLKAYHIKFVMNEPEKFIFL